ncbi:MAG: FeoB-associated Cys-rich membrane protein [Faecalibacterium sp.]
MTDIIVALVILAVLGISIGYIVHAKKNGAKCIGCPAGKQCSGHCGGGCACQSQEMADGGEHAPDAE